MVGLVADRVGERGDELVGLAHDDHVGERPGRQRVREGEGPPDHDQRQPAAATRGALAGQRGDAGQVQAVDQARQLQLVGERERDHREVAHGAP